MIYAHLSLDAQRHALVERLFAYESDHHRHRVDVALLDISGAEGPEAEAALEMAESAMALLDTLHAEVSRLLAELGSVQEPDPADRL